MRTTTTRWLACGALLAALAACDKPEDSAAPAPAGPSAARAGAAPPPAPAPAPAPVEQTLQGSVGKDIRMDLGDAKLGEAELGVPLYPGAKPVQGGATMISAGGVSTASVNLHSADSADKIAAYYRQQLKARAGGKQFSDGVDGGGNPSLGLVDTVARSSIEVAVLKAEAGSMIQIVSSWRGSR